jgi:hypothetical protein
VDISTWRCIREAILKYNPGLGGFLNMLEEESFSPNSRRIWGVMK